MVNGIKFEDKDANYSEKKHIPHHRKDVKLIQIDLKNEQEGKCKLYEMLYSQLI